MNNNIAILLAYCVVITFGAILIYVIVNAAFPALDLTYGQAAAISFLHITLNELKVKNHDSRATQQEKN